MRWPWRKRDRRESAQEAEYQAFLEAAKKKPARPRSAVSAATISGGRNLNYRPTYVPPARGTVHNRLGQAVSYGPVDNLAISCTYAAELYERYPTPRDDRTND